MIWIVLAMGLIGVSAAALAVVMARGYNRHVLRRKMNADAPLLVFPDSMQRRIQPLIIWMMVRQNRPKIQRMFPFVLDMLCLLLEAGLDFSAALARIASEIPQHPMGRELNLLLHDLQVGRSRCDSLRRFRARNKLPAITRFASLLIQADTLGAPIGQLLRDEAKQVRFDRFQEAERAGQSAAQKLLFPLIFCIMPVVFLVIFGPLFVQISTTGLGGLLGGGL